MRVCSLPACGERHYSLGFCRVHYYRQVRGTPLDAPRTPPWATMSLEERIAAQTTEAPSGCILWTGTISAGTGYGSISIGGRGSKAHRVVYELRKGPIPEGMQLDHLCRVRNCVNPDHLEPVTNRENTIRGIKARSNR